VLDSARRGTDTGEEMANTHQNAIRRTAMAGRKVTVNLGEEAVAAIDFIASERGITFVEALRRAIATEKFMTDETRAGNKILVKRGGRMSEILFR
jgi:hypothetical protein